MVFEGILETSFPKLAQKGFFADALEFSNKSLHYTQIDYAYNALGNTWHIIC